MQLNQRALVVEGIASSVYLLLCQGAFFTSIAVFFSLDVFLLGVTAAFPMAFQLCQIFAPRIIARFRDRPLLLNVFNACRFVWLIPIVAAAAGWKSPILFVIAFALAQASSALAGNVWMSLCHDVVPKEERGGYFGRRSTIVSMATLVMVGVYAAIFDLVPEPWNVIGAVGIGLGATFVSLAAISSLRIDPAEYAVPRFDMRELVADRNFLRLGIASMAWNFTLQISAPFFSYHQIKNLGMSMFLIGVQTVATSVLTIVLYWGWGRVTDRVGHKSVLMFGLTIVSIIPMLWLFMGPPVWGYVIVVDVILTGIGWSAVNLAMLTFPLETAKSSNPALFALFNAAGGLGGLAGAFVGGVMATLVEPLRFSLLGVSVFGIQLLFACCGVARLFAASLFLRVRAERYLHPGILAVDLVTALARRGPLRAAARDDRTV